MKHKNKFTKSQLKVMLLLAAVIVLMLGGLLLLNYFPDLIATGTPPKEEPHIKLRPARNSLSPHFNREINIGGSGDERLTEIFVHDDTLYIFGHTSSEDRDLDGNGGAFLALLNSDGSTKGFKQYGEKGDELVKATLCEGGFLLAVDCASGGSKLIKINLSGEVVGSVDTSGVSGEKFADLKYYVAGNVVAVMKVTDSISGNVNLKARVFDPALTPVAERSFPHACNLEYLEMFETANGYVIAANLVSPSVNRLAFIDWGLHSQGQFFDIDLGEAGGYKCHGVMPYKYGYAALIVDDKGICDVVTVSASLSLHSRVYLRSSSVTSARMFYAPNRYFCFLKRGQELASMIVFDDGFQTRTSIGAFSNVKDVYSSTVYGASAILCGASKNGIELVTDVDGKITSDLTFGGTGHENVKAVRIGGRLAVVSESSAVTSDCTQNFGGSDIWIAFMN